MSDVVPNPAAADGDQLSLDDAGQLQGFPADYPWRGSQTKQFQQIGNAMPPPLGRAVLAMAMRGVDGDAPR